MRYPVKLVRRNSRTTMALGKKRQLQEHRQQGHDVYCEDEQQRQLHRSSSSIGSRSNSRSELHVHVHLQTSPLGQHQQPPSIQTTTTSVPIHPSMSSTSLTTTTTTTTSPGTSPTSPYNGSDWFNNRNSSSGGGGSSRCSSTCLLLAILCCYVIMRDIAFGINASSTNEFYLRNFDKFHISSSDGSSSSSAASAVAVAVVESNDDKYNILCTATHKVTTWGSYIIRCKDLKVWADRCAPKVNIDLISRETLLGMINPPKPKSESKRRKKWRILPTWRSFYRTMSLSLRGRNRRSSSSNSVAIAPATDQNININAMQTIPSTRRNKNNNKYIYDATVSIKNAISVPVNNTKISFGKLYVDVVDNYKLVADNITLDVDVIVQNSYHANDIFPHHKYHVVEHWYNSFPLDMMSNEEIPTSFTLPEIRNISYGKSSSRDYTLNVAAIPQEQPQQEKPTPSIMNSIYSLFSKSSSSTAEDSTTTTEPLYQPLDTNKLRMGTIWTNQKYPCPSLSNATTTNNKYILSELDDISYDCIDRNYTIATWYNDLPFISPEDKIVAKEILEGDNSTMLGPGRLYYELFWKFDVLVIPVKRQSQLPKLRYGNVQRAVSQMRSGVPVLLELGGEVLDEFMERYNYTCVFVTPNTTTTTEPSADNATVTTSRSLSTSSSASATTTNTNNRRYWTFDEASIAMKDPTLRKQCQLEGLAIVKDYSPSRIAQKHLRALGYTNEFVC